MRTRHDDLERHGDLEIHGDPAFERREWVVQRIGWVLMALVLVLGLLGAFGRGPLSEAQAGDPAKVLVKYERFIRHGNATRLELTFGAAAIHGDAVRVGIGREYLAAVSIERMTPEPVRAESAADQMLFTFAVAPHASALTVIVSLEPDAIGWHDATIAVDGIPPVTLRQLAYP